MNAIDIIEVLLYENKISRDKMIRDIGLSKSVYWQWKLGSQAPSVNALQKIADYFDVSVDYLRGRPTFINLKSLKEAKERNSDPFIIKLYDYCKGFDNDQKEHLLLMARFLKYQEDVLSKKDE